MSRLNAQMVTVEWALGSGLILESAILKGPAHRS